MRLILRHGRVTTAMILLVFVWVVVRRVVDGGPGAIATLAAAAVVVWLPLTVVFVVCWPRITVGGVGRAIRRHGLGNGPISVNTLVVAPERSSAAAAAGTLTATGADDLLYLGGWLDVRSGPQALHVPEMHGRYYSVQLTDPVGGGNFAYVGTRTTGTAAGSFVLCTPGWSGTIASGAARIDVPHGRALLIGRMAATDDDDRRTAYALASQIRLVPYVVADR